MNIAMRDGRVLRGTALQIVQAMKQLAFGVDAYSLGQYIDSVVDDALKFEEVTLIVPAGTDEERAQALVDEMIRTELAARVEGAR